MNQREIRKANELLNELENIDMFLKKTQLTGYCVEVSLADENIYLYKRGREKIIGTVMEIRKDIIQELEKMGVEM